MFSNNCRCRRDRARPTPLRYAVRIGIRTTSLRHVGPATTAAAAKRGRASFTRSTALRLSARSGVTATMIDALPCLWPPDRSRHSTYSP